MMENLRLILLEFTLNLTKKTKKIISGILQTKTYNLSEILTKNSPTRENFLEKVKTINVENIAKELKISTQMVQEIFSELDKVGVDPRDVGPVKLRTGALNLEDLQVDEWVEGTVKNVVDFGCFVDFGVGTDGMLHKSQINNDKKNTIYGLISVGETVKVRICKIDKALGRIALSMKLTSNGESGEERGRKENSTWSQAKRPQSNRTRENDIHNFKKSDETKPQTNQKRKRGDDEKELTNPKKVKK